MTIRYILTGLFFLIQSTTSHPAIADNLANIPSHWRQLLQPVPEVDISPLKPVEQAAIQDTRKRLDSLLEDTTADRKLLASEFGKLGGLYQAYTLYTNADTCYLNAIQLQPSHFPWHYYSAYVAQDVGNLQKAVNRYKKARRLDPDYPPARYRLANAYLELNRADDASRLYRSLLDTPAFKAAAHYGLGQVHMSKKEYHKASEQFFRALKLQPEATQIHYPLALSLRATGNTQLAKEHQQKLGRQKIVFEDSLIETLETLRNPATQHFSSAMKAIEEKDYNKSIKEFISGLAYEPDNTAAITSLARALYLSGDKKQARIQLKQAIVLDPKKTLAIFLLALLDDEENNEASAITLYNRVLAINPEHEGANFFLANHYLRNKEYQSAIRYYDAAISSNNKNISAYAFKLTAKISRGDPDREILSLATTITDKSTKLFAIKRIRILLLALSREPGVRNPEAAIKLAKQLYQTWENPMVLELLALATASNGDFSRAAELMQKAQIEDRKFTASPNQKRMSYYLQLLETNNLPELSWDEEIKYMLPARTNALIAFRDYPDAHPI